MNDKSTGMRLLEKGAKISGAAARFLIGIGSAAILLVGALRLRKKKKKRS
jgi:hypothetical protein